MTHEDAGHYSAKHPEGTVCDPDIAAAVYQKSENSRITCAAAHKIAEEKNMVPAEVGKTIDLLEYRLIECQLGLFGYYPRKKIIKAAESVPGWLEKEIQERQENGKISCVDCWRVARQHNLSRMTLAAACDTLNLKISPCQLGAF